MKTVGSAPSATAGGSSSPGSAEVCDVCGDVLLKPETVTHLEQLIQAVGNQHGPPVYQYA